MNNNQLEFKLTKLDELPDFTGADNYILSEELKSAVDVALVLGQPLLLTGEPGTGKTRLATKIAAILHEQTQGDFDKVPLVFNTKTTSNATDLFYTYDALKHFRDANIKEGKPDKEVTTGKYIHLQALGKAIALSNESYLTSGQTYLTATTAKSSVVLIDEVDKAPRDFTNDILNEIEDFTFTIKETDETISQGKGQRIVVVMTSNSEKNLPDAFLRRCVFYNIPFPNPDQLFKIVAGRLPKLTNQYTEAVKEAILYFNDIRDKATKKPPATAELLAWLHILEIEGFFNAQLNFDNLDVNQQKVLSRSLSALIKNRDDFMMVSEE